MLATLTILTIAGGVLAFKAQNTYYGIVWTGTTFLGCTIANFNCTVQTQPPRIGAVSVYYTDTDANGQCELNKAYTVMAN